MTEITEQFNVFEVSTLPQTYCDPVEQLLHVAFFVLTQFVEKEHPFGDSFKTVDMMEHISWLLNHDGDNEEYTRPLLNRQYNTSKEIIALYDWWVNDRPKREIVWKDNYNWEFDEQCNKEDQAMFHRLVDVRQCLWT